MINGVSKYWKKSQNQKLNEVKPAAKKKDEVKPAAKKKDDSKNGVKK